jgi:hypothetical protein
VSVIQRIGFTMRCSSQQNRWYREISTGRISLTRVKDKLENRSQKEITCVSITSTIQIFTPGHVTAPVRRVSGTLVEAAV